MSFRVTLLANKSNTFGLSKDVAGLRKVLAGKGYEVKHNDPLEVPSYSDVNVHLEVPVYGWIPWATTNILMVNPEQYVPAWDPYLPKFDVVVVRDPITLEVFRDKKANVEYIPWGIPKSVFPTPESKTFQEFLWVLAGSKNKRAFAPILLKAWKPSYPRLTVTTTSAFDLSGLEQLPGNITILNREFGPEEREKFFSSFQGHICCSRAEGFGYTAAEAELNGAFTILNSLPCYVSDYGNSSGVAFLPSNITDMYYDDGAPLEDLQLALDKAMVQFMDYSSQGKEARVKESRERWSTFSTKWSTLISSYARTRIEYPPLPPPLMDTFPEISVVTLIYNRKKFFDLACHSLMISDYPKDKIEWIIVDDSDDPMEQNSDTIVSVAEKSNSLKIVYVPLKRKTAVSDKRNIGVKKCTNPIVLFMDDDDHYPESSIRRRVGWLTKHSSCAKAVACTTIACYDLVNGISSVNVPPLDIPLGQRISEATLTFYKSWWETRGFEPLIKIGEGESIVTGRETDVLEIPPQQIIVAFSHGKNASSRRVPSDADVKPGCFWGFPKEFLVFIHGLAGVKVIDG